jgi:hypothetical protein
MSKYSVPIVMLFMVLVSACAPAAPPTMSPADVEGTAVSAAWTMVAATQQAIPTATPVPPTETASPSPQPTFTPFAVPTFSTPSPAPVVVAAGTDNCLHPLNMAEAGPKKRLRINNNSGGVVNLSLNLWQINDFGQCGAISWGGKPASWLEIISVPSGSWYAYAWIQLKGGKSSEVSASFQLGQSKSDDLTELDIQADKIILHFP